MFPRHQMNTRPPAQNRFAGLDGLRAFAVGAVILYHLGPDAALGGYLGVDVFFVISGFLITALLLRERERRGRVSLIAFWKRRARRLLPALVLLLLACGTAAALLGGNLLVGIGRQVLGASTFSYNWLAILGSDSYFDHTSPELFRNLWSLAVEEQFYLVWPLLFLLLLLLPARWLRASVVLILSAASAAAMWLIFVPGTDPTRVYFGTDTHSFGLGLGATLALLLGTAPTSPLAWPRWSRVVLPALGTAALGGLVVLSIILPAEATITYRGGLVLVAVLTALTILGGVVPGSPLGAALELAPLRWIGERSYGLYLWHWPVHLLVIAALPEWSLAGLEGWMLGGIALAITVPAAAVSYSLVELPIRHDGFRYTLRRWLSAPHGRRLVALPLTGLLLGSGLAGVSGAILNATERGDAQAVIEAGQEAIRIPPPPPAAHAPDDQPAQLPSGDQITAIGDSVMLASAPQLQQLFPGIAIDAAVSRQMHQAPVIVQALRDAGALRPVVLIGLGTNGPIDEASLTAVVEVIGADHEIILVNTYAPRWWIDGVNSTLTAFARKYRNVEIANWNAVIAGRLNLLARDQVHPGDTGGGLYAQAVQAAMQRLAELPPVLRVNDYGLAAHPN